MISGDDRSFQKRCCYVTSGFFLAVDSENITKIFIKKLVITGECVAEEEGF